MRSKTWSTWEASRSLSGTSNPAHGLISRFSRPPLSQFSAIRDEFGIGRKLQTRGIDWRGWERMLQVGRVGWGQCDEGNWCRMAIIGGYDPLISFIFLCMNFRIGRWTYRPYISVYAVALATIFCFVFPFICFSTFIAVPCVYKPGTCRNGK